MLGNVPGKVWGFGRPLTLEERAQCFGMVPSSFKGVEPRDLHRMLGNTMGVEGIGSVLASVIKPYTAWEQRVVLPNPYCNPTLTVTQFSTRAMPSSGEVPPVGPSAKRPRRSKDDELEAVRLGDLEKGKLPLDTTKPRLLTDLSPADNFLSVTKAFAGA